MKSSRGYEGIKIISMILRVEGGRKQIGTLNLAPSAKILLQKILYHNLFRPAGQLPGMVFVLAFQFAKDI